MTVAQSVILTAGPPAAGPAPDSSAPATPAGPAPRPSGVEVGAALNQIPGTAALVEAGLSHEIVTYPSSAYETLLSWFGEHLG